MRALDTAGGETQPLVEMEYLEPTVDNFTVL